MTSDDPVIIEAAINGATTKAQNPHTPRTPEEIAADALAVIDAGAAIVHNHIDVSVADGEEAAARYAEAWRVVLDARPDALVYPTVNFVRGGGHDYTHIAPLVATGLVRLGLCDPGSLNLGRRRGDVPSGAFVYANSFDDIASQLELMREHALGTSLAIYEPGFLRCVLAWQRAGRLPAGAMVKLYFSTDQGLTGTPFGLPPTETALAAYLELLEGRGLPWAVSVSGGDVVASGMAELALRRGGHLHTGLEFYGGDRMPTNLELVGEAVACCRAVGRPVATPAEAAELMQLPPRPAP
jgi:uncharacterized protein (DUF849 family)